MSLLEKKYVVISYYGNVHRMTAKQLCERIKEDSKSDYNWISPARELVRVCRMPGFPAERALFYQGCYFKLFCKH